mgnify:CR=1 FL=1
MQPKNIKEFKELILRYESITLEEIEKQLNKGDHIDDVKYSLTGFGMSSTCTLCQPLLDCIDTPNCEYCIYGDDLQCVHDKTYEKIDVILPKPDDAGVNIQT